MKMKGYFILLVNLVVASSFSINTLEPDIVDIGQNQDFSDDLILDDIREPPFSPRSAVSFWDKLWTSPVPYVLDIGLELNAKGVILKVFDQFRIKSCIDFKPRDSEDFYLSIQKLDGCYSYVGREIFDGQNLSIGVGCDSFAIVEHEVLHALGFNHEHSRYDRDDYVQIELNNIIEGYEYNFGTIGSENSTTHETPYDYWSVMHYGKYAFSNGNGSTIITIDPKYQDVIGQKLEMSPGDVRELNLLYNCSSTVAFMFYCGFNNGTMCQMNQSGWEVVTQVSGGPSSDHTSLPSGNKDNGEETGYFMYASTASGLEGDSAKMETQTMSPKRGCSIQCLQFYYYHSGNESDELNIWIREFQDEQDATGTLRLMGQITDPTSHWMLYHVPLNATKNFQVVFEAQKGAGNSSGGFSVDDINLSETECPHLTLQINKFEKVLNTSASGARIYSSRLYSSEGYAYRLAAILNQTYIGMFVQLISGVNDDQLEWPCLHKQMTFQLLDQTPNMIDQMSKRWTFTTSQNDMSFNDTFVWDNPRETGKEVLYNNNTESVYSGLLWGFQYFTTLEEVQYRQFLKGGSAIFIFNFEDLSPLVNGSVLPCPQATPVNILHLSTTYLEGLDSNWNSSTVSPPPTITDINSDFYRNSSTITPLPPTTDDNRISSSITPPPTTNDCRSSSSISPPATATDNSSSSTISPPPTTTDNRSSIITPPPTTTEDNRTFCFSPGLVASPVLILLALLLLEP